MFPKRTACFYFNIIFLRFKFHVDSSSIETNYFRKNKKIIIEEEQFKILENKAEDEKGD